MSNEDVNVESLMAMNPDVVFFNAGNKELCAKLENAGLVCVGVSPVKWKYDCIRTYNEWIALLDQIYPDRKAGSEKAVDAYSDKIYDEIQAKVSGIRDEKRQKVLFLFQYDENTMITSGSSFFGQWWCDAVGAKNAAEEVAADNANAKFTMEQVYKWDPDVIIITNFTGTQPEDLYNNAVGDDDWSGVKAVRDRRVFKMPMGSYRSYTPGVDTPMTLEWMAQAVYPDLFADYDMNENVKAYYKTLYGVGLTDAQVERMYTPNREAGRMNK
jgi:iron complex transport system substrate-binding protein